MFDSYHSSNFNRTPKKKGKTQKYLFDNIL